MADTEETLTAALEQAGAAHAKDPSQENLDAHNRAAEALANYRAESRQGRTLTINTKD